ncbi:MAG: DHA2 family efflux MFS transporter permease subunit [Alphaproteobacteria bacterium]|nr:DHA2 family efflux MFS transporter permease subunit [Alphaproteobacteria bacterium]MBV9967349.1 DHA2 family efflux MFS transporter permease subunit [Alphaproteobacteria bacterium]
MTLVSTLRRVQVARRREVAGVPQPPLAESTSASDEAPRLRDWIGVLAMCAGLVMAIMDVQIVTSSLTQIQGGLSASSDEIAWVQTAYLIADVVMVPLSGMMTRLFSTRLVFVAAALGFTGASALCATATSLGQMILYRAMQGFCGGAITPTVWPVVYAKFRGPPLVTLMVIISMLFNISGTMGPTIGGFLTDTFSWHWLFLVNIVPGLVIAAVVWLAIDIDKPDFSLLHGFDVTGLVLMAIFLGCLQYALEEGPRWDWLDEQTIRWAIIVSAVAGGLFFWRVLSYRQPIVDLRAFLYRNFALGAFFTFIMGIGMYGTTYLVPLFLAQVRGLSALQIGETVFVVGVAQLVLSPFNVYIARAMDLRLMLAIGLGLFAYSMYLTAGLTNQTGFWELVVPQVVRGIALMFCYVPANMIALGSLPQDTMKNAAGLYNLMRDLGGAIGLASIGTVMNLRLHFHWNRLIEDINPARAGVQQFLDAQTNRFDSLIAGDPHRAAIKLLANMAQREALVLTYNDLLLLLGALFVFGLMLLPLVRRPQSFFAR